eukprot:scaffold246_cov414-Prasinococcus_capsulatus_cf.AAC.19
MRSRVTAKGLHVCTPTVYISTSPQQRLVSAFNSRATPVVLRNPMNVTDIHLIRHLRLPRDSALRLALAENRTVPFQEYMAAPLEERAALTNTAARYLTDSLFAPSNVTIDAEMARERLNAFSFVGIEGDIETEARVMQLFSYKFNLNLNVFYHVERWNGIKDILADKPDLELQILEENPLDAELHAAATRRFEDDYDQLPEDEKASQFTCATRRLCFNETQYLGAARRIRRIDSEMQRIMRIKETALSQGWPIVNRRTNSKPAMERKDGESGHDWAENEPAMAATESEAQMGEAETDPATEAEELERQMESIDDPETEGKDSEAQMGETETDPAMEWKERELQTEANDDPEMEGTLRGRALLRARRTRACKSIQRETYCQLCVGGLHLLHTMRLDRSVDLADWELNEIQPNGRALEPKIKCNSLKTGVVNILHPILPLAA